jgi:hypothetical protein
MPAASASAAVRVTVIDGLWGCNPVTTPAETAATEPAAAKTSNREPPNRA